MAHVQKDPNPWWFFWESPYRQNLGWAAEVMAFLWWFWWWGDRAVFRESPAQLKLPSFPRVKVKEGLRRYCSVRPLSRKQDPAPWPRYRLFLQSLTSLTNPHPHPHPFRTQGEGLECWRIPLEIKKKKGRGDRARLLYPGRLHRIQFQFQHSLKSICWHFILITLAYLNSKDPCLSANVRLFFFLKHLLFT